MLPRVSSAGGDGSDGRVDANNNASAIMTGQRLQARDWAWYNNSTTTDNNNPLHDASDNNRCLPDTKATTRTAANATTKVYNNGSSSRGSGDGDDGRTRPPSPRKKVLSPMQQQQRLGRKTKQPKRRRRRKRTEAENDLFTSFTLNRDPENSKYLPYDEVVYPKLFNRPKDARRPPREEGSASFAPSSNVGDKALRLAAAAELDSMWVVGFVENARRRQKDMLLRELRDFVRLPGSTVLPGAHAALATISQIDVSTSFNSSKAASMRERSRRQDDGGRSGSAGGGRHGSRRGGGHDNGSVQDDDDDDTQRDDDCFEGSSGGHSALTPIERLRLRELEKRLSQASLGVKDADVRHNAGVAAYGAANRKLRKILRGARPPTVGLSLKSEGLEAVFRRNREELAAAVRIQRLYKHYYRQKRFDLLIRQLKGVVRIQALARGVISRRFVAEWYSRRSEMVLAWQTVIRRMLSNIHWKRQLAFEQRAASKIQAVGRGRAGRKKARRARTDVAVLRIQCLWRGCVDRARVDRMWLGVQATRIQGLARVMVAKRVVGRTRRIFNAAARSIQRTFRGNVARKAMFRLIWERAMARRVDFLRVLAAEEDWERENMELTARRSRRMRLEERLQDAFAAETVAHAEVFDLEVGMFC